MPRAREPRPLKQRRASTVFLRVPAHDWTMVARGQQPEFRAAIGNVPQLWDVSLPTLCVAYRKRRAATDYAWKLMLLEEMRVEALGAITEDGLRAAGYRGPREEAYARFRRDWMIREKRRYEPLRKVVVFRVREIVYEQDIEQAAMSVLVHLYGEHLEGNVVGARVVARSH